MIRALRTARRSAVKSRTQAANQLRCLRVTAPEGLRHRLRGLSTKELVAVAARSRLKDNPDDVMEATRFALRSVARRYEVLSTRQGVRCQTHCGGQEQARECALPKALRVAREVYRVLCPPPRQSGHNREGNITAVTGLA